MENLKVKGDLDGFYFDIDIPSGVSILRGDSATGKTFLFDFLSQYIASISVKQNIKALHFNFLNKNTVEHMFSNNSTHYNVIMFDNADLYLTGNIITKAENMSNFVLVAGRLFGCGDEIVHELEIRKLAVGQYVVREKVYP